MGLVNFIKRAVKSLFARKNIQNYYDTEVGATDLMPGEIDSWLRMYAGRAPWISGDVVSLRIEKSVVREFANIALNEMTASVSNKRLDGLFKKACRRLNQNLQQGLATGAMVIKPLSVGSAEVQYIPQSAFIPLRYNAEDRLVDVIFPETVRVSDTQYLIRLERHTVDGKGLTISNRAFKSTRPDTLDKEIPLHSVPQWAAISEETFYQGVTRPVFGYYVNPIDNDIDGSSAGVSVFAAAAELIKKADLQFGRLDREYKSAERRIHVDSQAVKLTEDGESILDDKLYKGLDLMPANGELYKEYSLTLRDEGYRKGLNEYKREIEFTVGLSYGDISDPQSVDKTAEEVRAAKQRKYDTVSAIQTNLKECLEDLVYALAFYNSLTASGYEFSCTFKDSILTDEKAEREADLKDLAAGVMRPEEYRAKWYGETLEQALKNLPEAAQVID